MIYIAFLIFFISAAAYGQNERISLQNKSWTVRRNTIFSMEKPKTEIKVASDLKYLGELKFFIKDRQGIVAAEVNRFIFADKSKDKKIHKMFVVQFESLLPAHKNGYSFEVKDATRLGSFDYQTDSGEFNFADAIAEKAGSESEYTKAFFIKKAFDTDGDFMTARYARIVDAEKRSEIIFFYHQNVADLNLTRADIDKDDITDPRVKKIVGDFMARALKSFNVSDNRR